MAKPVAPADLNGVGIGGLQPKCSATPWRHQSHRGRVAAYQAVHFGAFELRIGQRRRGRIAIRSSVPRPDAAIPLADSGDQLTMLLRCNW